MTLTQRAIGSHERVVWATDAQSGLRAVAALPGDPDGPPALAAVARAAYADPTAAVIDALGRAERAGLRADVLRIPIAGASAVLMGSPGRPGARRALRAFGDVVAGLGGDVWLTPGLSTSAADLAATGCPYTAPDDPAAAADASARAALAAIRGGWERLTDGRGLRGVHVHLHGAGDDALWLARLLAAHDAAITVDAPDGDAASRLAREVDGRVVPRTTALTSHCDVLAPCAPGLALGVADVEALGCRLVAGPAEDQVACDAVADALTARRIAWVPDLVAGAGPTLAAAARATGGGWPLVEAALARIATVAGDLAAASRDGLPAPAVIGALSGPGRPACAERDARESRAA